jgi:hypothetical protein
MFALWFNLTTDTTMLAFEASTVIQLRVTQFAVGRGTFSEANQMVAEKGFAFAEAAATLLTGGPLDTVVNGYRRRVRANISRLTRPRKTAAARRR